MNIRSRPKLLLAALGLSITCFLIAFLPSPKTSPDQFGIIVDCGSSGSRIYIFTWKEDQTPFHPDSQLTWAPRGEDPWILEIKGGIQSYGNSDLAAKSLTPLFDYASSKLPSDIASNTDIFVMATAGLRELGNEAMEKSILEAVYVLLRSNYPFRVARQNVQVLEPNLEAAYFWVSMYTYMKGTLNISQPLGVTEMGGASMQIAFQPDPTEQIPTEYRFYFTDSSMEITYKLYANSFAGFGFNSARRTIYEMIAYDHIAQNTSEQVIVNPCLFAGQSQEFELDGETFTMKGNGDFDRCKEFTLEFINKTAPCEWERCSFGGHYQPKLKGEFILADNFGKIIVRLTGAAFGKVQVTPMQLDEVARDLCSQDFSEIVAEFNDTNIDLNTIGDFCYGSAYALNLLVDGFGFPKEGELTAVYAEAYIYSWPLGAMVVERQKKMFSNDAWSSGNLSERKEIYQEPLFWCIVVAILIGFVVWRWSKRNSSGMTRSRSSGGFMHSFVEVKFH